MALSLQLVELIDIDSMTQPKDSNENRQADSSFCRGEGNDEEDKHLTVKITIAARKSDERQRSAIQHQLDAHEQHEQVPPQQEAGRADHEQQRCYDEIWVSFHRSGPVSVAH